MFYIRNNVLFTASSPSLRPLKCFSNLCIVTLGTWFFSSAEAEGSSVAKRFTMPFSVALEYLATVAGEWDSFFDIRDLFDGVGVPKMGFSPSVGDSKLISAERNLISVFDAFR